MVRVLAVFLAVVAVVLANPFSRADQFKAILSNRAVSKPQARILEELLHNVAECIRDNLNTGIEEFDVAPANPLLLDSKTLYFENLNLPEYITGSLTLENLYLEGLTSWEFSEVSDSVSLIPLGYRIYFTVDIPKISGSSKDFGEMVIYNLYQLVADGEASGYVENIHVKGNFLVGISDGISVESVELTELSVGDIEFTISGLTLEGVDISEVVTDFVSNSLSENISTNNEAIRENLAKFIVDHFSEIASSKLGQRVAEIVKAKCLSS